MFVDTRKNETENINETRLTISIIASWCDSVIIEWTSGPKKCHDLKERKREYETVNIEVCLVFFHSWFSNINIKGNINIKANTNTHTLLYYTWF